jgi:N utilization substance protein A
MERVKSTAEDAALMEAMGEISAEEEDAESLTDLEISEENLSKLSAKAIKNKDDLAELAVDELQDIIEISNEDASALIMKAREHWFN